MFCPRAIFYSARFDQMALFNKTNEKADPKVTFSEKISLCIHQDFAILLLKRENLYPYFFWKIMDLDPKMAEMKQQMKSVFKILVWRNETKLAKKD